MASNGQDSRALFLDCFEAKKKQIYLKNFNLERLKKKNKKILLILLL